jgi:hypothetical protein
LAECFLRKTTLIVLSNVWVTVNVQSVSKGAKSASTTTTATAIEIWKLYYTFLSERLLLLSAQSERLHLRPMTHANPDIDHRVETALWKSEMV